MDTPIREAIREALREMGPSRIVAVKARTGLGDLKLYASILQMEDMGEVVSNRHVEHRRGHRVYRLHDQPE